MRTSGSCRFLGTAKKALRIGPRRVA